MAAAGTIAVYGALLGNLGVAVTKFWGASITGSSAMLSEAIHSIVDTTDQVLLLVGRHRSRRPADAEHPFGHGKELYFWALMVAVLIFGLGGGVSAYEGWLHIRHPEMLQNPMWNYVVLGCAFVFEGASFAIGLRSFHKERGSGQFWKKVLGSKDPTIFTVLAEDSSAIAGLVIAFLGIYFSHRFNMPVLDGLASVLIGVLLAGVASFLIYQSRGLLVGEGMDKEMADEIRRMASSLDLVDSVSNPVTMYFGPENVFLALDVNFRAAARASEVAKAIDQMEERIQKRFPEIKRIYIEAQGVSAKVRSPESPQNRG
ncbi:MAG TPA: cation diffusion facilitator family transporter [Bryobacteraceae bacterium]|nr:cation diffusion facilitator family transporter [Bryobacteraceae bacterium]